MDQDGHRIFDEDTIRYLKDILKCNNCLETPKRGPIFQCSSGHLLCSSCSDECSQCNDTSNKCRSVLAERILDEIPAPCDNSGCETILYRGDLEKHLLEDCIYRKLPCIIPTCDNMVPIRDIVKHVDREHVKSDTFTANGSSLGHYLHVDTSFFEKESWWKPTLLEICDEQDKSCQHFSFQCHRTESGQWKLWVYCVGSLIKSRLFQYQIILSLGSEEVLYRDQTVYLGHTLENIIHYGYGLSLSDEGAKRFWDPNEMKIRFRVAVFRKTEKTESSS
ncbi:uncharacterized protein [Lepeophtheirus salmonis]|uniref:uncharacterized protein n=1 Tax=Lepeophtheirus salmonis TaxID=72036 RepID=UPI001AE8E76D|nr:E3 ubiquitin-protein ligase SINA-like 8 [Lepeophtheirus salmonis]